MYDLIIVGAGPAGLAAALYATRKRMSFMLVSKDLGGKSNYSITIPDADENQIIQARELVTVYRSRVESLRHSYTLKAVDAVSRSRAGFVVKLGDGSELEAHAVLIATGTTARPLGVTGEREHLGKALGYSAISYSHVLAGRHVFLCGDSSRVLNSALELSLHAEKVTVAITTERSPDERLLNRVSALPAVTIHHPATIHEFTGDEFATGVRLSADGAERTVEADAFFVETDPVANSALVSSVVSLGSDGAILVDTQNMTAEAGLFAAGDVTGNGFEQVLVALGEGTKAILSIYHYLLETNQLAGRS